LGYAIVEEVIATSHIWLFTPRGHLTYVLVGMLVRKRLKGRKRRFRDPERTRTILLQAAFREVYRWGFPLRFIFPAFCESHQHESPPVGLGQGNSNAACLPETPTNSSMPRISSQQSVVCVTRTQRHSASAVAGKSVSLKVTPASVSSRLTGLESSSHRIA
jgi:hypothetical protein